MELQPLVVIVVGLIVLGIVWRLIKGVVKLVLTVALLGLIAYFVLNYLR